MMTDDGTAARRRRRRVPELRCRTGASAAPAADPARDPGAVSEAAGDAAVAALAPLEIRAAGARGEGVLVELSGEIDLRSADMLRLEPVEVHLGQARHLVLDFGAVTFCDAAGLGALVALHKRVTARGGEVRLARVRPAQVRLLRVTGLHRVFPLYDRIDDALEGRARPAPIHHA